MYPTLAKRSSDAGETFEDAPTPDRSRVHRELRRKGVARGLLWEEYKRLIPAMVGRHCKHVPSLYGQANPGGSVGLRWNSDGACAVAMVGRKGECQADR